MSETKIKTKEVRFSYPHVFEPASITEDQPKKYSCCLIIDANDKVTLDRIEAATQEAAKAKWGEKMKDPKFVKKLKFPLRDGDEKDPPEYKGKMFISASSMNKPAVFDENGDGIIDKQEFYAGCYGLAILNFYAFEKAGNIGVAVGLNGLKKTRDGARLSGGYTSSSDFEDDDEDDLTK